MDDWHRKNDERQSALWERLRRLGVLVPIDKTARIGSMDMEILETLADCATTAVLYRVPRDATVYLRPVWPPELMHRGGDGTVFRDLHVSRFGPVRPDRTSVRVAPSDVQEDAEPVEIEVPVNRSLTASSDRSLMEPPDGKEMDGVRIVVEDAGAGLVQAWIDVRVEVIDPNVLAVELGDRFHGPSVVSGPGPGALWRDWFPEDIEQLHPDKVELTDGTVRLTLSARAELTATADPEPDLVFDEEPPPPDSGWSVRLPGGDRLGIQGWGNSGGLRGEPSHHDLRFDPPPPDIDRIELVIDGLYAFHFGGDRIRVPGPDPRDPVDLAGHGFEYGGQRMELLSWERNRDGAYALTALPPSDWQADLRVMADDSSVSLWSSRRPDGSVRYTLPRKYNELFERGEGVDLRLRLVGKPVPEIRFDLPLTAPGQR